MIERGEGVYVWNSKGRRLFDAYAGLAVVNVGHGRAEIADAVREQVAKLAYYPTTRQFSNPPAARLAARLAGLTPGDLSYTLFAVSGSEANERSMQIARVYWLKVGRPRKYKVISLTYGYHGATLGDARHLRPARHGSPVRAARLAGLPQGRGAVPDVGPRRGDRRGPGAALRRPPGRRRSARKTRRRWPP